MIRNLFWLRASAAAILALAGSSCYYDTYAGGYGSGPAYGGTGYATGGYSSGYGGDYVDASFASGGTSFIFTSSPQWFYDPVVFCYYDRYRSCYYDPYLGGYYPRGYCPRPIYGAPYPRGWRPGSGTCPPPWDYRDRALANYRNRVDLLRERNYAWASNIRERNDANVAAWQNRRLEAARNFQENRAAIQDRNQQLQARNQANFANARNQYQLNQAANRARFDQNQAAARARQQNWANQFQGRPQPQNQSAVAAIRQEQIRERIAAGQQARQQQMISRPQFSPGARSPQVSRPQFNPSPAPSRAPAMRPQPQVQAPQSIPQPRPVGPAAGRGGFQRDSRR